MAAFFRKWKIKFAELLGDVRRLNFENAKLKVENAKFLKEKTDAESINLALLREISILKLERKNPEKVVEAVLAAKLQYIPLEKMTQSERAQYFVEAQALLRSDVVQNEKNYLLDSWGQWALTHAQDFNGVRDMRMTINGMQLLLDRLNSIPDPNLKHTEEDLYSGL